MHLTLYLSSLQNLSLAEDVAYCVFSLHQYEPRPEMSLSSHAGGEGGSGGEGGGDGNSPSHTSQVFLHFSFLASEYFLHFLFLHLFLVLTHGGGLLGGGARPTIVSAVSLEPLRSALVRLASAKSIRASPRSP